MKAYQNKDESDKQKINSQTASIDAAFEQVRKAVNENQNDPRTLRQTLTRDFGKDSTRQTIFENLKEGNQHLKDASEN